ncbi:MAG: hypothetical protein JWO61_193 [Candidatus Saccharibacteria bacterium]|nr:hypothetical protein [Candidatus Saccharibacteria bacterium]
MFWTITWVTAVALVLCLLAVAGTRTDRLHGEVAITAAAFGWTFVRWAFIDVNWFLIRSLEGGWVWLTIGMLITSLLITFVLSRDAKLIGIVALLIAVLAPFGDLFSEKMWSLPVASGAAVAVLLVAAISLLISRFKMAGVAVLCVTGLVLVAVIGASLFTLDNGGSPSASASESSQAVTETPSATPTETETVNPVECPAGFAQKDISDPKLNRFIKGGIDAKTALKSSNKLLEAVRHDASSLLFYARTFGIKDLPTESEMLTADGTCLSEVGQQLHHDLGVVMNASSKQFGEAPADAYNSGVTEKGTVVIDTAPGISGANKKAVHYTLPDGTKVIILVRCGNPVFASPPPGIPHGPTDNPGCPHCGPPPPHHVCPPGWFGTWPNCLQPKDPNQDPGPQGNAPEGGGNNDNNGPGSPNPQPTFPSTPYTTPPAPTSTPSPQSTPPPPPATGAPGPTEAPSTCVPPPGKTEC